MSQKTIVTIGGVAGGATAACKARRVSESARIVLIESGPYPSFSNCLLPYFIGGEVKSRGQMFPSNPQKLLERYNIETMVNTTVTKIDPVNKIVHIRPTQNPSPLTPSGTLGRNKEAQEIKYDKLILSPGADAIIPPVPGIQASNINVVKTVPDADSIIALMHDAPEDKPIRNAVVVGAGYIGIECAEALKHLGLNVTVVELAPHVLPTFDADIASLVEKHLRSKAEIAIVTGDGIAKFNTEQRPIRQPHHRDEPRAGEMETVATSVVLQSGKVIPVDLVIMSVGVRPNTLLAKEAGLKIGNAGGIVVNEYCQTSDPDIYAAGDAVESAYLPTGEKMRIALAGPANKQGRIAGANAAANTPYLKYKGSQGTSIVMCMGITAAQTGLTEAGCKKRGIEYQTVTIHPNSHVGGYPGSTMVHLKLVVDAKDQRILGAQACGVDGEAVAKRIDVLATVLHFRGNVDDLMELDPAYAPPFNTAKDPVVMGGFVTSNIFDTVAGCPVITFEALREKAAKGGNIGLLDMRDANELERDGQPDIAGLPWTHIPVNNLRGKLGELDQDKDYYLLCHSGLRSYLGARILLQHGFKATNITGGMLVELGTRK